MGYQTKKVKIKKSHIKKGSKIVFWFLVGAFLGIFLLLSFAGILFEKSYQNVVYPGVIISNVNFGGKTKAEVKAYFVSKNNVIKDTQFIFTSDEDVATMSARDLHLGYDADLISEQAMSVGRSQDAFTNINLIIQAYLNGITLPISYTYSDAEVLKRLSVIIAKLDVKPIDALFTFENGKVTAFRQSVDGQTVDTEKIKQTLSSNIEQIVRSQKVQSITIPIPMKVVKPALTTEKVNNLGIKDLLGTGTSLFQHSIDTRIYNVTLGSSRLNGILVKPGETFSFDQNLGDVSAFTGYKQAYVIQNGKTVLGDGGGICQVSTTFFRAILSAGLPVVERHAHAYRVGYYEEDGPPGIDATVYVPSVDLKFKNDTGHYILIENVIDPIELRLTFYLYGTKDDRQVTISTPVITSQTPAPEAEYQDDPTLPKGTVKQIDFAAAGANVYFIRQVIKDGQTLINEKFVSNYQPWRAVYLRGTQ